MMLISMILDPEACISDAGFFSVGRTNQRTDGQADSRSWMAVVHIVAVQQWFGSMEHFRGPEHQQLMPWCDSNHAVTTGCSTILTHIHTYTYTITHTHSLHIHLHTHVIVHTQTIPIMQSPLAILKYTLPNITQDGLPR